MMIALVAMFVRTMSANAQNVNNYSKQTFDRATSYLQVTINQSEPVKTSIPNYSNSIEAY